MMEAQQSDGDIQQHENNKMKEATSINIYKT